MSCFGHVLTLPNGEIVEAAGAAAAAATAAKAAAAAKAEKVRPKKKKPCVHIETRGPGTGAPPGKPGIYVLCTYQCGDKRVGPLRFPGTSQACVDNIPSYEE